MREEKKIFSNEFENFKREVHEEQKIFSNEFENEVRVKKISNSEMKKVKVPQHTI